MKLRGEWRFYWKTFLPPAVEATSTEDDCFIVLPGFWKTDCLTEQPLSGKGYATFALTILLPEKGMQLAAKLRNIQTAYTLYADGKEIASVGTPGKTPGSSEPAYSVAVVEFENDSTELELMLHVSNYELRYGGIWENMEFGLREEIRAIHEKTLVREIFLISCIVTMGLYHLFLFLHRRKDLTALYFGIFCLLIAFRSLVTGELYVTRIFPSMSWPLVLKFEYLTFYLGLPVFLLYLHSIFPEHFSVRILKIFVFAGAGLGVLIVLTPPSLFTRTLQAYQIITGAGGGYSLYTIIKALIKKQEGAAILLFGFVFIFAVVINDVLHSNQIIHTGFFLSTGLAVFLFSQAFLISLRFNRMFQTIENQATELIESRERFDRSRIAIILGLAKLAEYRDEDTGTHLERMREYCKILAGELSRLPLYRGYITKEYIEDLYQSAILHDIGKVGVPDAILLKPARLTAGEFEVIKQHTRIGGDAISNVEVKIKIKSFLTLGREIAYSHHEKWDGSGYPEGRVGEGIPLSARIVALADVYDALTSERPYKKPFSHEEARQMILKSRGTHFDPDIVDAFIRLVNRFREINDSFREV